MKCPECKNIQEILEEMEKLFRTNNIREWNEKGELLREQVREYAQEKGI